MPRNPSNYGLPKAHSAPRKQNITQRNALSRSIKNNIRSGSIIQKRKHKAKGTK